MTKLLFAVSFFFLSLWDFYVYSLGVRPFDFIVMSILALYLFARFSLYSSQFLDVAVNYRRLTLISLVILWSILFCYIGALNDIEDVRPMIGLLLGVFIFVLFYLSNIQSDFVLKVVSYLIFANVIYLLFQTTIYYLFGILINPYAMIGLEPRAFSSIFRPTGLYLEPASYSLTMLMLLSIRFLVLGRMDWLFYVAILSIWFSISLWGIVASSLFVLFNIAYRISRIFYVAAFVGLVLSILYQFDAVVEIVQGSVFDRLMNFSNDSSGLARYGFSSIEINSENYIRILWGSGVSSQTDSWGWNGLAFFLAAFGLIGSFIFFMSLFLLNRTGNWIYKIVVFFLVLTAAPMWNVFFWWAWLAVLLTTSRAEISGKFAVYPGTSKTNACSGAASSPSSRSFFAI